MTADAVETTFTELAVGIEGIVLRRFRRDDVPALVRYANDPRIAANLRDAFPHPYTEADARAWLGSADDDGDELSLALATPAEVIGGIGLKREVDVQRASREIGYWVGAPFWGRGIATAAVRRLTDWAFAQLEVQRVWGGVYSSNPASCRVLEKAGYLYEGTLRHSVTKRGRLLDQLVFARVRGDESTPSISDRAARRARP